jgi:ABC-type transport system involved in multi-copper enzyme maturation permease subunit
MNALLALFLRSLREGVRLRTTYFARAGLVAFVLIELVIGHLSSGWTGAPGLKLFSTVTMTNLIFISLVGLSYFASAIAEEKEEMTLGLLRMTDLNPLSILLGKSTSRICGVLLLLAAQFPFTLLAVAFGGVSASQVVAAYACLGAFIFLLANLALVFSVVAKRTAGAAVYTALVLLILLITPGLLAGTIWMLGRFGLLASQTPGPRLAAFIARWESASPFMRLNEVSATGFHDGPLSWQVVSNLLLGLVCFALAWLAFHHFADQPGETAPPRTMAAKRISPFAWLRARRPWRRALLWKDFYFIAGGKAFFAVRLSVCAVIAVLVFDPWATPEWSTIGYAFTVYFGFLLVLDLTFAASRIFRLERKAQTLSSLAILPMTMRRLVWQKIFAALLASLPLILCFLTGLCIAVPSALVWIDKNPITFFSASASAGSSPTFRSSLLWFVAGAIAVIAAGSVLVMHLAAWLSLRLKSGAFPLALAICGVGIQIATALFTVFFGSAGPFVFAAGQLFAALVLHFGIGRRLEELAAED